MPRFAKSDFVAAIGDGESEALRGLRARFPALPCFADGELAAQVTLAEAAHMAGVSPETFLSLVNGEGSDLRPEVEHPEPSPAWAAGQGMPEPVDVRPWLAAGTDPRERIVAMAEAVPFDGLLAIVAPFDPVPLRKLLGRMGFSSHARHRGEGDWYVLFHRDGGHAAPAGGAPPAAEAVMDLRSLEPPGPMVAILSRIEAGEIEPFEVLLSRDPVFLYPELAERGWRAEAMPAAGGEVRLRLSRDPEA